MTQQTGVFVCVVPCVDVCVVPGVVVVVDAGVVAGVAVGVAVGVLAGVLRGGWVCHTHAHAQTSGTLKISLPVASGTLSLGGVVGWSPAGTHWISSPGKCCST